MGKQSAEEVRKEVLEDDSRRDVSIYVSVPIGVLAGMSSMAAVCAVIAMRALVYFRHGVDAYWLSCVPFLFPVLTGLFAAYKKQFSLLGVHLTVTLLALLMGGFGFGLSVEPIFIDRQRCVPTMADVSCHKPILAYLYLVSGSAAAAFAVLSCLLSLCALNSASKRMANRRYQAELAHLREVEEKQKEIRQMKTHTDVKPSIFHESSSPTAQTANGTAQVQGNVTSTSETGKGNDNVTTKL